jgi:hypothetical protein
MRARRPESAGTSGRARKDVPDVPDGWALACVHVAATVPDLSKALETVLRAAESGELDRADVARIVAARWDLTGDAWFHYMADGQIMRETPAGQASRPRRSVAVRAG